MAYGGHGIPPDEKNGTLTLKNLKTREQQAGLSVMQAASIILKKN